jgi:hypothetical protein
VLFVSTYVHAPLDSDAFSLSLTGSHSRYLELRLDPSFGEIRGIFHLNSRPMTPRQFRYQRHQKHYQEDVEQHLASPAPAKATTPKPKTAAIIVMTRKKSV